ncbi:MAG TPA: threonine synthase [Ferruginibacter sp.]|nr:threonine synthase [Ferruginibacter sp.]
MKYYSINRQSPEVNFKEATIRGQAPDKGLYFPGYIPKLDAGFVKNFDQLSNEEIAFRVIQPYVGDTIPEEILLRIVSETVNFPIPLVRVNEWASSLELFHGNTLAFKDIGARFMSRCLGYFVKDQSKKVTVLVATSGDTGGAVADGFYGVDDIDVVILYPSGKVSMVQEKQLSTLGKNIHAVEVAGSFDDCQQMVKQAFMDQTLSQQLFLTSANSINVARWLPQQFFYFFAAKQWSGKHDPLVISVPSGNVGNICAGLLARQSGLSINHLIAACNANDVVPSFMKSGQYRPQKSVATISNAMDVGDPSNFVRILEMFNNKIDDLQQALSSYTISDEETKKAIREVYNDHGYLLDPHGAVGYLSLQKYLQQENLSQGIFLETAHPVKFYDVVEPLIGKSIDLPEPVARLMNLPKVAVQMPATFSSLKDYLMTLS